MFPHRYIVESSRPPRAGARSSRGNTPEQQATGLRVLQHLLDRGADPGIAARGKQGRPIDAARGPYQDKKDRKDRIEWAEGAALPEDHSM
ncbi:hypothetical protein GCM10010170_055020 [Dactylosporangium salmoneum]|uniref:Uncharacterized protein n=1 Tax=Dactylosporangium salmoneum TaxID=53361 RepID=A0ABP5TT69_9ACTN